MNFQRASVRSGFQFTHPGRGATTDTLTIIYSIDVSIHAPREGCDIVPDSDYSAVGMFQFTHPGRGATPL